MEFTMNENGFQVQNEYGELKISGQSEYGHRPYQLLVSSIAGCSGGVLRKVLNKMRVEFEDIYINADVKRNPDQANRIEEIDLTFVISGTDAPPEKIEKALHLARKNCAMVQSVQESIRITETFELRN